MRFIRGFPDEGVIACFEEPNTTGAIDDFNAARNAPAADPINNLSLITFHQEFFQYELAFAEQSVTVSHAAVATDTRSYGITISGATYNQPGVAGGVNYVVYGKVQVTDHTLFTHGLGYVPKAFVSWNGAMVSTGTVVQVETGRARFVTPFATSSIIGLREVGYSSTSNLSAASRTYNVLVFRNPAADPAEPLWSGDGAGNMQMGRGKIDVSRSYLRRKPSAESHFDIDLGRTIDIRNGRARSITGGNVATEDSYGGSFSGPAYVPVGI